jgi:hypothetical protein
MTLKDYYVQNVRYPACGTNSVISRLLTIRRKALYTRSSVCREAVVSMGQVLLRYQYIFLYDGSDGRITIEEQC